ncbi:MAG: response regulator, partial [bacterium]|nr:response regulator [bacterium]
TMASIDQMLADCRDQHQQARLCMMVRNSRQLLVHINQLLDLARFDSGKMKLQAACYDIVLFVKGALAQFREMALQKKLDLEFHAEQEEIFLYFDAPKMEDVMYNLLINAVKFTPSGRKITVSIAIEQREQGANPGKGDSPRGIVNISVQDTGSGIPKQQLEHIFDRFFQAKDSMNEYKGTGIGLALVKENLALHRGKIDVHSQEEKGTVFIVRLPMGHEHLKPNEITSAAPGPFTFQKGKGVEAFPMVTESETAGDAEAEAAIIKDLEREKPVILVVEDNADVREYICGPLKADYTMIEAGDGEEGIRKANNFIPDLIISDIMMPGIDGKELCRVLKKEKITSHIPIILLTARASEDSIRQGLEIGADDYVTKPFSTKILMTRIKNLIQLRCRLQQRIREQVLLRPAEIPVSSIDREFIEELRDTIENNLSESDFNVESLSKKLYMNRNSLYRKIKALTGETPTQFIRSYRLKRAAQLLKDNFGNVSQVCLEVGFSNFAYFSKCFKEQFHILPSDYQISMSRKKERQK